MDEVKNQTSEDFHFDFTINGKINKKLEPNVIKTKIPLVEVDEQADCKFAIEDNNKANLNCIVNVENYKEIKTFSFKSSEIMREDNKSIYLNKLNEIELINEEVGKQNNFSVINEGVGKKKNYVTIIIILVICGILFIVSIIVSIILLRKNNKKDNEDLRIKNDDKSKSNTINIMTSITGNIEKTKDDLTSN